MQINAFQRVADVIVQKSFREGFGLTVSEGLWKGRPVVGGRAGGIKLQIRDGFDGYLVDSIEECGARIVDLLRRPGRRRCAGRAGPRARARQLPLDPRARGLAQSLQRAFAHDARHAPGALPVLRPRRRWLRCDTRRGWCRRARCCPLVDAGIDRGRAHERVAWITATIDDGDGDALAAGRRDRSRPRSPPARGLDAAEHRLHYDIVSNATLWFLHHGLFDLPRRPRFDEYFRAAWDAYVRGEPGLRRRGHRGGQRRRDRDGARLPARAGPGDGARGRPISRCSHFMHTPFCGPRLDRALDRHRSRPVPIDGVGAVGFHTARWAHAYQASARTMLGLEAPITSSFATPLGPDPDALAGDAVAAVTSAASAELDDVVGDRKLIMRTDRIDPTKNIVRGFLAFDAARSPATRNGASEWSSSPGSRRRARAWPSTWHTGRRSSMPLDARQRSLGTWRLATRRHRRARRLRAQRRRFPSLRRAVREPGQGRPEPRRQGRPGA